MQPVAKGLFSSPHFTLQQTPSGGRSLFATVPIPANTLIHVSYSPSANVIYREFRKVVCAWCFLHRDQGRKAWRIASRIGNGGERFCQEQCRDLWIAEGIRCGGLRECVDNAIDAAVRRVNKAKFQFKQTPDLIHGRLDLDAFEVTQATLDAAWMAAGCEGTALIRLDEIELEIARFVASALVQLHTTTSSSLSVTSDGCRSILSLQKNELPHTLQRPYILPAHIRTFQFLRSALWSIPDMRAYFSLGLTGDNLVRKILGRDAGNSFGIWEQALEKEHDVETRDGDREMFGWGIWVDASFFNHNCTPNITKTRLGRSLHFMTNRDIVAGEELCISYVDVNLDIAPDTSGRTLDDNGAKDADILADAGGSKRRKMLREQWYFNCACERCSREEYGVTNAPA